MFFSIRSTVICSATGSECSSTSDLHRPGLNQGQDDGDGISTSGQVDHGQFRLVPNDNEDMDDRHMVHGMLSDHVPDVHEDLLEDISEAESIEDISEAESMLVDADLEERQSGPSPEFKRPYNRKGRFLDHLLNYNASSSDDEPIAGPSGVYKYI